MMLGKNGKGNKGGQPGPAAQRSSGNTAQVTTRAAAQAGSRMGSTNEELFWGDKAWRQEEEVQEVDSSEKRNIYIYFLTTYTTYILILYLHYSTYIATVRLST